MGKKLPDAMQKLPFESESLQTWFAEHKRDLPWRQISSPYAIWISEIMLQQTQVSVVRDYFIRWMQCFPTMESLAEAPLEVVIKMWEGLGYYSRARHLHAAARHFCECHGGKIPGQREALEVVKGLGPYTIGAILAFAFHKRVPAVDANVVRVLARYYGIEEDVTEGGVRKRIWDIAEQILPEEEPWTVVEGLIELGALVCTTQPRCALCPIKKGCSARITGKQASIPVKKKREKTTHLIRHVAVIHHQGWWLLKKGSPGKLMADLYEFPYFDREEEISLHFPFSLQFERQLSVEKHSFTRYRAHLFPTLWKALEKKDVPLHSWVDEKTLRVLAFSSGHRRILEGLDAHITH